MPQRCVHGILLLCGALPALCTGIADAQTVHVSARVEDTEGTLLPARVSVRDANGEPYPGHPDSTLLSHSALGSYFYTDGTFSMDLPPGMTDIVAGKGCEWAPTELLVNLRGDTTLTIKLTRAFDLRSEGWYPGDAHVHTRHYPSEYDIGPEEIHMIARCEDLAQAWCLDQDYEFTGGPHEVSTPEACIYYSTEYRNMAMGHLGLLGLKRYVGFGCCWPPDPVWPLLCDIHERWDPQWDETMVLLHPQTGADFFDDDEWPGIGLGRELPVVAAAGYLGAMEILVYTSEPDHYVRDWYALLNCGLRIPPSAGTDACVANYLKKPPGGYRVYVLEEPGEPHDHAVWAAGLKAGRCFVSNYPLIPTFTVNGAGPGEVLEFPGPSADVDVHLRVESALALQVARVLRNGVVVNYLVMPPGVQPVAIDTTVSVHLYESGWIAVRVDGETDLRHAANSDLFAHTAPIYVHLDGEPVRRTADAAYFLDWIDTLEVFVEERDNWEDEEQHEEVLARLQAARAFYAGLFVEPPGPFHLELPGEGDSLDTNDPVLFRWTEADDPETGDRLRYRVELAEDSLFSEAWVAAETTATEVLIDLYLPPHDVFWWRVVARDFGGNETISSPGGRWFYIESAPASAETDEPGPHAPPPSAGGRPHLRLWPNPSRGAVSLHLRVPDPSGWGVEVFDLRGRLLGECRARSAGGGTIRPVGPAEFLWIARDPSGRPVPSGIYWIQASPRETGRIGDRPNRTLAVPVLIVR